MFANDLKMARVKAGLTGRETARRCEISSAYYSQLETGARARPPDHVLSKLCEVLNVNFAYFASGDSKHCAEVKEQADLYSIPDRSELLSKIADLERQLDRANDTIAAQARTIESMQNVRGDELIDLLKKAVLYYEKITVD